LLVKLVPLEGHHEAPTFLASGYPIRRGSEGVMRLFGKILLTDGKDKKRKLTQLDLILQYPERELTSLPAR
jgi:hypothetical protein